MAERLSGGNVALALLANALATGFALYVLITVLAPVSGALFNPCVTLVLLALGETDAARALRLIVAQTVGGILGVVIAHVLFDLPLVTFATATRTGAGNGHPRVLRPSGCCS